MGSLIHSNELMPYSAQACGGLPHALGVTSVRACSSGGINQSPGTSVPLVLAWPPAGVRPGRIKLTCLATV